MSRKISIKLSSMEFEALRDYISQLLRRLCIADIVSAYIYESMLAIHTRMCRQSLINKKVIQMSVNIPQAVLLYNMCDRSESMDPLEYVIMADLVEQLRHKGVHYIAEIKDIKTRAL